MGWGGLGRKKEREGGVVGCEEDEDEEIVWLD
jgi:hypothetical protein